MKTKKYILIGVFAFLLVAILFAAYHFSWKKVAYHIRFEGTILSADGSTLTIQGIPQNDVGHRGQYIIENNDTITVSNSTDNNIDFSALSVGDHLEIYYTDYIAKSKIEQYELKNGEAIPDVQQIKVVE